MRIAVALAFLAAACGPADSGARQADGGAPPLPYAADDRIECRPAGVAAFERTCSVGRADGPQGRVLTIRKPDGGFRRLLVTDGGRGVAAADGAEPAHATLLADGRIEAEIGGDRFRLPAERAR